MEWNVAHRLLCCCQIFHGNGLPFEIDDLATGNVVELFRARDLPERVLQFSQRSDKQIDLMMA